MIAMAKNDLDIYMQKLNEYYKINSKIMKGLAFIDSKKTRRIVNQKTFEEIKEIKKFYSEKHFMAGIKYFSIEDKYRISSTFIRLFGKEFINQRKFTINELELKKILKEKNLTLNEKIAKEEKEVLIPIEYENIFLGRGMIKENKLILEGL